MEFQELQTTISLDYVLNRIYTDLGGSNSKIEITGVDMANIIIQEVLPLYSKFFPWEYLNALSDDDQLTGKIGFYKSTAPTPILSISRVVGGTDSRVGAAGIGRKAGGMPVDVNLGSNLLGSMVDLMDASAARAIGSNPVTARFHAPLTIEMFPKMSYNGEIVVLNLVHPPTLHTIPWNMIDEFYQMCLSTISGKLRKILKKFGTISTIYGEIVLDLEDLDEELAKKPEILEKWRRNTLKQANKKRWYIA